MFRGLLNDAKSAMGSVLAKYLARASVAVPFLIAAGFAIAAITIMLVDRYGQVTAYWIMAAALALIGAMASLVVSVKEQEEEAAEEAAAETADTTAASATAAVAEAAAQNPMALLTMLSALPMGPASLVPALRLLARNLPLVVLLAAITFVLWPSEKAEAEQQTAAGESPEGSETAAAPSTGHPEEHAAGEEADDEGQLRHRNGADPLPSQMRH
jgi:hypothetical protein